MTDYDKIYKKLSTNVNVLSGQKISSYTGISDESFKDKILNKIKNPIVYCSIILILTSIILVVLKPSFLKVKNEQTGEEKINYGYMIATILGISFCVILCIYFVLKKF
jgi:hypothetical protein